MTRFMEKRVANRNKLRKYDLDVIFKDVPEKLFKNGLELGAGDGFQSKTIIKFCESLIATDYNEKRLQLGSKRKIKGLQYKVCDAEDLPFKNNTFDFIFSSHLLEHIKNKKRCFSEMKRVLKKNGVMIYVMPNRLGKSFNFFLYYPFVIYMLLNKERRQIAFNKLKQDNIRSNIKTKNKLAWKKIFPSVHGENANHLSEFYNFGKRYWVNLFKENNFVVRDILKMSLSSGYRFGFRGLRKFGLRLGLCTSFAYVVTKKNEKSDKIKYFIRSSPQSKT